ncbi:unnamed protein product [Arctogadus glacialis]
MASDLHPASSGRSIREGGVVEDLSEQEGCSSLGRFFDRWHRLRMLGVETADCSVVAKREMSESPLLAGVSDEDKKGIGGENLQLTVISSPPLPFLLLPWQHPGRLGFIHQCTVGSTGVFTEVTENMPAAW